MKKTLLLLASVALLLVGCAKENFVGNLDGEMTKATFTACVDGGVATRASADNDGNGTNVNRCIMEIYFQDQFYTRLVQPVTPASGGTKAYATFANVPVVAGKTYKVLFWADHVDVVNTEAGLATDKYYTTKTTTDNKGLKAVTVNKTNFIDALKSKKNDELDAFFFADNYTVPQNQAQPFPVTLKRPFAQLNVITTDVAAGKTVTSAALLPDKVSVSYKADNTINVATGETSKVGQAVTDYTFAYEAPVYGDWITVADKHELTLSMDYILASTEQGAVDVTFKTFNNGDANPVMTHNLTNLPYKRNYRTNVKGDLLTTGGSWKAEIEPKWGNGTDSGEIDHIIAATYTEADLALKNAQANGQDKLKIELTQKAVDQMTADETGRYKRTDVEGVGTALQFILYETGPVDLVEFQLPELPTDINAWIIDFEAGYPTQEVAVNTAEDESKVIIKAPRSTVTLNNHEYSYVSSMTAENTLIVPEDVTINELKVVQGNVLVYGVVKSGAVTYADGCTLFHGIRSDISVDNLNNSIAGIAGEWKSNIVKIAHDGKVTDGKTFTVPSGNDVIIEGDATLAGQLKIANSAKVTVKSGTFADVLTFTGSQVAVEGGRFNDIVAEEATGFITGGLFQVEPNAEYVNPQYEVIDNEDPATKAVWPYTVGAGTAYVAKIGTKLYMTFNDALNDVQNGETIVILKNTAGWTGAQCSYNGQCTIDLNGKTLSGGSLHGPLCFQGGTSAKISLINTKATGGIVATYPEGGSSDQYAAVSTKSAKITINGGSYSAPDGYNVLYSSSSGRIDVNKADLKGKIYGGSVYIYGANCTEYPDSKAKNNCYYRPESEYKYQVSSSKPADFGETTAYIIKTSSCKPLYFDNQEGPDIAFGMIVDGSKVHLFKSSAKDVVLTAENEYIEIYCENGASYTGTVSVSSALAESGWMIKETALENGGKRYKAMKDISNCTAYILINPGTTLEQYKIYDNLDKALTDATYNDEVTLMKDLTVNNVFEKTSGVYYKLNLNGHTITMTKTYFTRCANITLKDLVGGGKIISTANNSDGFMKAGGMSGGGTTIFESGIYEAADNTVTLLNAYRSTVTINGGTFKGKLKAEGWNTYAGHLVINGGVFDVTFEIVQDNNKKTDIKISGGKFKAKPDAKYLAEGATCSETPDADGYYIVTSSN